MNSSYSQDNALDNSSDPLYLSNDILEEFNLTMKDDELDRAVIRELDENVKFWNRGPWNLKDVDVDNLAYLLGDQIDSRKVKYGSEKYIDNRLFSSVRAILSYATGQLAKPEITPSRSDDQFERMARQMQQALYQHSVDEYVAQKVRVAVLNLLTRKRGYLKQRYDPNKGTFGDIQTEVCDPSDVTIDRFAGYISNPKKIYHRQNSTVEELCIRFKDKQDKIYKAFGYKYGTYGQLSYRPTWFECWFTYYDKDGVAREGVTWFLPEQHLIMGKIKNPNWIYTGSDKKDREENVTTTPIKPFTIFNYFNTGRSFIDETSLFEQAKPQQDLLNNRLAQINKNTDLMNGRWVVSNEAMSEEDASKFVNKGAQTVMLVNSNDVGKSVMGMPSNSLPQQVYQSLQDSRQEIDTIMGTPSVFRGENPQNQDTLGRDMMVKQQAGAMQDDLVRCVDQAMGDYYKKKLQMMRVYYTDDYWFQTKGADGKFDFIMLNGDNVDSNVRISVQPDSTLPLDKASVRATSLALAKQGLIDPLTLFKDLGLPDPDIRAERLSKYTLDKVGYMDSVSKQMENADAEVDLMLVIGGKDPQERDDYTADYLGYINHFMTTNRFATLDPKAKQRVTLFLKLVSDRAQYTAAMNETMLDNAGMLPTEPMGPQPRVNVDIKGEDIGPDASAQLAGVKPPNAEQPQNAGGELPPVDPGMTQIPS